MINVELLKNHPKTIPRLAEIWHEVLGKIWVADVSVERVIQKYGEHLNADILPMTYVALEGDKPVGMASLRINDGIRPDLTPWLGSLVVDPGHQNQGVGKQLIDVIIQQARILQFNKLYLFAFDLTIPKYYARLGWQVIGVDEFNGHPVTVMEIDLCRN